MATIKDLAKAAVVSLGGRDLDREYLLPTELIVRKSCLLRD